MIGNLKYRKMKLYKFPLEKIEDTNVYKCIQYKVFGHYDGLSTSIIEGSFFKLYVGADNVNSDRFLDYQNFILFVDDDEKDQKFWLNTEKHHYLFISFLHLPKGKKSSKVDIKLFVEDKKNIIVYNTLDNADIIICQYVDNYADGVNLLSCLFLNKKIDYMYTFLASHKSKLCEWKENDEILNNVTIRYMINNKSVIDEFNKQLITYLNMHCNNDIQVNLILGHDDCSIIIPAIPANDLMYLYTDNQLLDEKNDLYREAISSSDTRLGKITYEWNSYQNKVKTTNATLSRVLYDKVKKFYQSLDKTHDDVNALLLVYHGLEEIIKVMMKHESGNGADYIFLTLYEPMNMLIDKISIHIQNGTLHRSDVRAILTFLEDAVFVLTRSSDSSIQLFQLPVSLNHLYEAPGKLISFYSSFMYFVKELLNTTRNEYAFLVSPLLKDMTEVQIIFAKEEPRNRLILVKLSAADFYDSQKLLSILTHELSHFVGDERARVERIGLVMRILTVSISEYLFTRDILIVYEKEHIEAIRDDFSQYLLQSLIHIFNRKNDEEKKKYHHAVSMLKQLTEDIQAIFNDDECPNKIHNFYDIYNLEDKMDEKSYCSRRDDFVYFMFKKSMTMLTLNKHVYIIRTILEMFRECYADLVMVKFLKLSKFSYLDSFKSICLNGNADSLEKMNGNLIIRTSSIIWIMDSISIWKQEDEFDGDYAENIEVFLKNYANREDDSDADDDGISIFDIDYNFKALLDYLKICNHNLTDVFDQKKDQIADIQAIYNNANTKAFPEKIDFLNGKMRDVIKKTR